MQKSDLTKSLVFPAQMFPYEFREISHNSFFLKNASDGCFCINIFQSRSQKLDVRRLISTHSKICDGAFLAKIVNSLKPLSIFAKKASL